MADFGVTVTAETAARLRPDLERLVAEFRALAHLLVGALPNPDESDDIPDSVVAGGRTWWIHWHDPHYLCEDEAGVTVEAHIYDPDLLDPWFLLLYARSVEGHEAVLEACPAAFHDMARLFDLSPDLLRPPQRG
ncbi:hypothetical protein JNUCC0626_31325 [Lentzea sp. JNUCC 0626]|uniref:hypothetical protein n=1 Tax=Lentzea sp. JNUCC 0626 TaxID=3367513 RepID=UPI0037499C9A